MLEKFAAVQMIDVHLPTTDGRQVVLSRYTQPERELQAILDQLKLNLTEQPPPRITSAGQLADCARGVQTFSVRRLISKELCIFPPPNSGSRVSLATAWLACPRRRKEKKSTRDFQEQLRENNKRRAFDLATSINPKAWNAR